MNSKIDKEQVRRRFAKHLPGYDALAVVQRQIAARLAGYFAPYTPKRFSAALEVGCGTGFLTRELLQLADFDTLILNDLVAEALPPLRQRLTGVGCRADVRTLPGDVEQLALPQGVELIASASVLQWLDDLEGFFTQTYASLKPGGWLVFNLFGPENLHQVKSLTGNGLDYRTADELRALLEEHFEVVELRQETIRQEFDTPFDVLRHLQQTGVTATGRFRWTPSSLRDFQRAYTERYSAGEKVILDWDVIYVIARKRNT